MEPIEWLEEESKTSSMCNYWKMILGLQLKILLYVRSLRESNFQFYVSALARFMMWFFEWIITNMLGGVVFMYLICQYLEFTTPRLYEEFNTGTFSFQNTMINFSNLMPDQVHEQNNEGKKGFHGATHLFNRPDSTGLEEWGTSGPELVHLLNEFEEGIKTF